MCYSYKLSFSFFIVGIISSIYFYNNRDYYDDDKYFYLILLYYSLMELLQTIQYFLVNECDNMLNVFTTNIAYVLIILQPLLWNMYFYINAEKKDRNIFKLAIILAIIFIIFNIITRLLYNKTTYYRNSTRKETVYQYKKGTCTRYDKFHLYWTWNSIYLRDLHPNMLLYFLIWFIPALLVKKFRMYIYIIFGSLILSYLIALYNNASYTVSSTWCYLSIFIVLMIIIVKGFNHKRII